MERTAIPVAGRLPKTRIGREDIADVMNRLERDFENYAGMCLLETVRLGHLEPDQDLQQELEAAMRAEPGEEISYTLDIYFEPGLPPELHDVDRFAALMGLDRAGLALVALAAHTAYVKDILDDPATQAAWDEFYAEVARLPDGWSSSM